MIAIDKSHLETNNLSALKRKPSQLLKYIEWSNNIKAEYGSVVNYICRKRLQWEPQDNPPPKQPGTFKAKNPIPFADPADYKILYNDWPYGLAPEITHLVVWLKTPIAVNPEDGSLLPEGQAQIQAFVHATFIQRLNQNSCGDDDYDANDKILWFKNWFSIQSVGALEHIHILVRDVDESILAEWVDDTPPEM